MRTEVCITVDTEFSIAGAFTFPERYVPLGEEVVRCVVEGREEGLGFILKNLTHYNQKATFFVEALQTSYFGDVPMGRLVNRIAKAGHDVQLHLHPCWLQFANRDWKEARTRPNDSCTGRSDRELDEMIGTGCYAFGRWSVPRPIALRAGGFEIDRAVYRAMTRAGIKVGSNIGMGIYQPQELALRLSSGRHWIEGVLELPVLSYLSPTVKLGKLEWRALTITGTSWPETKLLLMRARQCGISQVVLVTHAFEFIKSRDYRFEALRRNRLNQSRFCRLLDFLRHHEDEFVAVTFREASEKWLNSAPAPDFSLRVPLGSAFRRIAENVTSDHLPI